MLVLSGFSHVWLCNPKNCSPPGSSVHGILQAGILKVGCHFLQRRAMPKNVQTTVQFCLFHMLARLCSKSFKLGFSSTWPENLQFTRWFQRGRGTRDHIASICWIMEKAREFQKNIYFCFIDYAKAFDSVDYNEQWQILTEMVVPDHLTCLRRNL